MPRHKQTAVARNRVKRRLRELVRGALLPSLSAPGASARLDVVVRAMPDAYGATLATLAEDLRHAAEKLGGVVR